MGNGEKHHLLNFHLHMPQIHFHHHHHHGKKELKDDDKPKGILTVMVEQQKFAIPLAYMNHPLLVPLLTQAAEDYEFHYPGPIVLPCNLQEFRHIQDLIHQEELIHEQETAHHHHHHHHHNHYWCFKA